MTDIPSRHVFSYYTVWLRVLVVKCHITRCTYYDWVIVLLYAYLHTCIQVRIHWYRICTEIDFCSTVYADWSFQSQTEIIIEHNLCAKPNCPIAHFPIVIALLVVVMVFAVLEIVIVVVESVMIMIMTMIMVMIMIMIIDYFYSVICPIPLRGAPDYSNWHGVGIYTPKRYMQLWVKDLPKVPRWRLERYLNPLPLGRKASTLRSMSLLFLLRSDEKTALNITFRACDNIPDTNVLRIYSNEFFYRWSSGSKFNPEWRIFSRWLLLYTCNLKCYNTSYSKLRKSKVLMRWQWPQKTRTVVIPCVTTLIS